MPVEVKRNHALTRYREKVPGAVKSVVASYGARLDNMATSRAPRKTGTLKRSVGHEVVDDGWAVKVGIRNGLPYARIQDLGGETSNQYGPNSGHIQGNRYLTGSFKDIQPSFRSAVRRAASP